MTAVIDGQDPTAVKVENGIITVSGLAAGNYTMNVTTVPDENHTAVSKLVNVTVNKVPSTLDVQTLHSSTVKRATLQFPSPVRLMSLLLSLAIPRLQSRLKMVLSRFQVLLWATTQ